MDEQLRAVLLQYRCSVLEGLHKLAGVDTTVALADKLGIARQTLMEALQMSRGRSYAHVRRSIEAQMGLSQYLLDELTAGELDA
jgi:hypothetical protein